ncbi:unnamed protein product [Pleuronectes platessa]|uniref:Fatty acid hydroxylase domain-containing protein n=1 Tax=Pleuronectes platessa TaxID=8262 RepID=A0A9N7VV74_PLEPL|nr:unnamed protein product [Pleuronectes platessa]
MGDRWARVQQFKIQPSRRPTASTLLHCAGVTLYNHVFLVLPASVAQWAWRPPIDLPDQNQNQKYFIAKCGGGIKVRVRVGVPGLVDKANCSREEAGLVAGGFGPDGPQPPARGRNLKEFVTRVGRISHNLACTPQGPRGKQAPFLMELTAGVIGNLLLFDFQYFIWHLLHHRIRWLYVTFHAIHHNFTSPFALTTQCLGGWELITVGFWTTLNPVILRCHLLTTWAFMVVHVYVSIEDHCGYDFPWSTSRLIPFGIYGGPSKHDVHHQKPNTNFAPHFCHWDKIFGTYADVSFSSSIK